MSEFEKFENQSFCPAEMSYTHKNNGHGTQILKKNTFAESANHFGTSPFSLVCPPVYLSVTIYLRNCSLYFFFIFAGCQGVNNC